MSKAAANKAKAIAEQAMNTALKLGAESVIVMIGLPDGGHSAYYVKHRGPCLALRGLLEISAEHVRGTLKFPDKPE